jgi:hypothetical protein
MVGSSRKEITDSLDRRGFRGIDDISGTEPFGLVESLRLDVDDDDPRSAAMRAPLTALSPTPPAPKITTVSPALTFAVFKTEPAPVTTPQPSSAAWANGSSLGRTASWFSWMSARSPKPPNPKPWNKPAPLRLRRGASEGRRSVNSGCVH